MGCVMGKMKQHFADDFGNTFAVNDIGERVYQCGWNAALEEAAKQIEQMPFGEDTVASFAVFLRNMKERMP
jgi:hypothetical protein